MIGRRSLLAFLALAVLPADGAAAARLPALSAAPAGPYRLGAGDEVRLIVYGFDAINNVYRVGDGGTIALPIIESVPASGHTTAELEQIIAAALRDRGLVRAPSVAVQVQRYRPFYILGEVARPGQYDFVPGMSVLAAVSVAGGFTFRANQRRVVVVRNTDGKVERGLAGPETLVQPGDTISVPEDWF